MQKVVRSVCYFSEKFDQRVLDRLVEIAEKLRARGFLIQTTRICSPNADIKELDAKIIDPNILFSIGTVSEESYRSKYKDFLNVERSSLNLDLTDQRITSEHVSYLFNLINDKAAKTFNFTYVFNNASSSPYFPSATYLRDGFSVGLQPTDLAEGCESLEDWFDNMEKVWWEIVEILKDEKDFLGIDSSIAPLFEGNSSLVEFVKRLHVTFDDSVLTDTYLKITKFIKEHNPRSAGLCGLMIPCLEDFELAHEYEAGNFSIERNLFLSLHSGLGVDVYPIGIDESPERVLSILKVVQGLSNKYKKPLSVRFVSDGKSKIGQKSDFQNQYLKDVVIRVL